MDIASLNDDHLHSHRRVAPGTTAAKLHNLLISIAWMGEVTRHQVQRIWYPDYHEVTVKRALARMTGEMGLLDRRWWYDTRTGGRKYALYSLKPHVDRALRAYETYPVKARGHGQERLFAHDTTTNEVLSYIIAHGRNHGLSGVFTYYEYRLDPPRRQPCLDALIILHTLPGAYPHHDMVPWTRYAGIRDEGRSIRLAIETDRNSEAISVVAGKAIAYAHCGRPHWIDRHGHMPTPTWVVPNERRLWQVWKAWKERWPQGFFRIATTEMMSQDRWYEYFQGEEFIGDQAVGIFDPVAAWRPGTAAYERKQQRS